MKKQLVIASVLILFATVIRAQDKFFTKVGEVVFSSKTSLENIEAHNKNVTCVLDTKTGNLQFAVLMKGFEFEKALMQEHFNENYVESHKFPKADFKGQISNFSEINFGQDGKYTAKVRGKLTIHGETRDVETTGVVVIKAGKIKADANFAVELADYKIEVPKLVKDNISKAINVTVDCTLEPLKS